MEAERERCFEEAESSARSFAASLSVNSWSHRRTFQRIVNKYEKIALRENSITRLEDWSNEREAVSVASTGLFDTDDLSSGPDESATANSPDKEFVEKARNAFLTYCKEPSFRTEESVDVDDCNVGLMTEVETDYNPVDSGEEVTTKSKRLQLSPFSRKRSRHLIDLTLSDDEGQTRSDMTLHKRPPRKKKKGKTLFNSAQPSEDGNEGDDEFEKTCDNNSHPAPPSKDDICSHRAPVSEEICRHQAPALEEICSLCVIEPEHNGATLPAPRPHPLCSCCQPTTLVAGSCLCPQCVGYAQVQGYTYASSEGVLFVEQVEYVTEANYPYHAAVLAGCSNGQCISGQPFNCECQTTGIQPNMNYSFMPATVQPCTCIDCTPLP